MVTCSHRTFKKRHVTAAIHGQLFWWMIRGRESSNFGSRDQIFSGKLRAEFVWNEEHLIAYQCTMSFRTLSSEFCCWIIFALFYPENNKKAIWFRNEKAFRVDPQFTPLARKLALSSPMRVGERKETHFIFDWAPGFFAPWSAEPRGKLGNQLWFDMKGVGTEKKEQDWKHEMSW